MVIYNNNNYCRIYHANLIIASECSHAIVPAQSLNSTTVAHLDSPTLNVTYILAVDNSTNNSAAFKFNETDQSVNSSFCHISCLEVYRGKEQAIEIGHDGFSLNNNGNIEVVVYNCDMHL